MPRRSLSAILRVTPDADEMPPLNVVSIFRRLPPPARCFESHQSTPAAAAKIDSVRRRLRQLPSTSVRIHRPFVRCSKASHLEIHAFETNDRLFSSTHTCTHVYLWPHLSIHVA